MSARKKSPKKAKARQPRLIDREVERLKTERNELRGENARLRLQCEQQLAELGCRFPLPTEPGARRQVERLAANLRETAALHPGTAEHQIAALQGQLTRERESATEYKAEAEQLRGQLAVVESALTVAGKLVEKRTEERDRSEREVFEMSKDTRENLRQLALAHLGRVMRGGQPDDVKTEVARDLLHATE